MRPIRAESSIGVLTTEALIPISILAILLARSAGLFDLGSVTVLLTFGIICAGHALLHAGTVEADEGGITLQRPLQTGRRITWEEVKRIRLSRRWWWPVGKRCHRGIRIELHQGSAQILQKRIQTHLITGLSAESSEEALRLKSELELQKARQRENQAENEALEGGETGPDRSLDALLQPREDA